MAGSFTNWMENRVMNFVFSKVPYTPGIIYVGLSRANPGEAATGGDCQEVPNNFGYLRVGTNPGDWTTSSGGSIHNNNAITFPSAIGGPWGLVTHFVLLSSIVYGGGNVLMYSNLIIPINITIGSLPRFEPSRLYISLV